VPPDFSPLIFFFKQLLLVLVDKPRNDFDFLKIFAEIFDFSGASPVSLTPVKLSKTVKVPLTGVVNTGEELLTGVNDTGNACFAGVVDADEASQ
jgi:hypothetical protein